MRTAEPLHPGQEKPVELRSNRTAKGGCPYMGISRDGFNPWPTRAIDPAQPFEIKFLQSCRSRSSSIFSREILWSDPAAP